MYIRVLLVSAGSEYKQVIENLRRRPVSTQEKKRKSDELKKPTHTESNDDDWLEDDLGIMSAAKKRKSSIDNLLYTSNTKKFPSSTTDSDLEARIESINEDSEDGFSFKTKSKRKKQISLISAGFLRSKTSPPRKQPQTPIRKTLEADSSTNLETSVSFEVKQTQMFSVDVRIEEKLYRVPVPASEINVYTIKWLAEEASKRYFK